MDGMGKQAAASALLLLVVAWSESAGAVAATTPPSGASPVREFRSAGFGGGWDNYRVHVLADGRIAVSNDGGLALHDGQRWTFTPHPDGRGGLIALSLTADQRLCGAFFDDPGCFEAQADGRHAWVSQRARLQVADRTSGRCMNSWYDANRAGTWLVYTRKLLFLPDDPQARVERLEHPAGLSGTGGGAGRLWLASMANQLVATSTDPEPGRVRLEAQPQFGKVEATLKGVQPGPADGSLWFLSMGGVLLQWSATTLKPLAAAHAATWRQQKPMSLLRLRDGHYAVGFFAGPLRVLSADGQVVETYGEAQGVPEVPTHGLAEDAAGGLWLAQSGRVLRLDRGSATTTWGRESGLGSSGQMLRWAERTLLVSNLGLHAFDADAQRWQRLAPELAALVTHAAGIGDTLLLAGSRLLRFDPALAGRIEIAQPGAIYPSRAADRAYVIAGAERFEVRIAGTAIEKRPLPPFEGSLGSYLEQDAQTLWAMARLDVVERWQRDPQTGWQPGDRYAAAQGLPAGAIRLVVDAGGTVWAGTTAGLRRFDPVADRFVDDLRLPGALRTEAITALYADPQSHWWVQTAKRLGVGWWQAQSQRWEWDEVPLAAIPAGTPVNGFWRDGEALWVLRADGVSRIDLKRRQPPTQPPPPYLARLTALPDEHPLALTGALALARGQGLRAQFGWPQWTRPETVRWRTRLSGVEADFGTWSERAEREWSNLPHGQFRLEVEVRDALGSVQRLPALAINVAPPWFLGGWAWALWAALGLGALWSALHLGTRLRQRQLLLRQAALEQTVAERTCELDQKNRELAEQAQRLTDLDRLKTRFFLNAGHEFRTPLTLILGPLEDLLKDRREPLSERTRSQLELAQRNAGKVLDLVVELMDVNRLEQRQFQFHLEAVDLRPLLRRVADAHRPLLERYGHVLELDPGDAAVTALIDVLQLERALSNLLSNAAKFMPRGGRITLTLAAASDGSARITVADQGRGIPAAALPHVFDRFFQAEDNDRASGHGIGLALVHEIVQAHGGDIQVQSTPGIGSTFTLTLPRCTTALAAETAAAPDGPAAPLALAVADLPGVGPEAAAGTTDGRPCVLIIDDHADLRQRVRDLLAPRFEVIEAADGERGWQRARDELPDLIVADVMMPGCDGVTLTRRLRQEPATAALSILLLTARVGTQYAVEGLRAGANDYLAKPFDAQELCARCDALLDHARRLRFRLQRDAAGSADTAAAAAPAETADDRWRRRLRTLIAARLHDPAFDVETMAGAMHADRSQLFRRCKELFGASPSDLLRESRLNQARERLLRDADSVSEIAYAVGYERLSSFTRAYVARYGQSPSETRASSARERSA